MKKSLILILTTSILIISIFTTITPSTTLKSPIKPAAANGTKIWTTPSNITLYTNETIAGQKFNVSFWLTTDKEVGGVQITTFFKHNVINITRWWEPSWNSSYIFHNKKTSALPYPPNPSYRQVNSTHSKSKIAVSLFPTPPTQEPFTGTGLIAILEFEVNSIPEEGNDLTSLIYINNSETYLMLADGSQFWNFTKMNGYYKLCWNSPPQSITIEVHPNLIKFTPYESAVGQKFNVTIRLKWVISAYDLQSVNFSLIYDNALLSTNQSNVKICEPWQNSKVETAKNSVNVTVSNPTSTPNGTVLLANVTFTVKYQDSAPPRHLSDYDSSKLNFEESYAYSSVVGNLNLTCVAGEVRIYARYNGTVKLSLSEPIPLDTAIHYLDSPSFLINVSISEVFDIKELNFTVKFDPNMVTTSNQRYYQIILPEDSLFNIYSGLAFDSSSVIEKGLIRFRVTPLPGAEFPYASGLLFQINFTSLNKGTTYVNVTDLTLRDTKGNSVPIEGSSSQVEIIPEFPNISIIAVLITLSSMVAIITKMKKDKVKDKIK